MSTQPTEVMTSCSTKGVEPINKSANFPAVFERWRSRLHQHAGSYVSQSGHSSGSATSPLSCQCWTTGELQEEILSQLGTSRGTTKWHKWFRYHPCHFAESFADILVIQCAWHENNTVRWCNCSFQQLVISMNNNISALLGAKRFLFSSYASPAPEKSLTEGADIGGKRKIQCTYLIAKSVGAYNKPLQT